MIWIRADGGKEIGIGHIMRCLSVADALRQLGEQVCFLLADDSSVPLLKQRGQEYRVLDSSWREPETELDRLPKILGDGKGDLLLADSYFVTAEYLRQVGTYLPVCYVDDMGIRDLPVDLLINYNIFADGSLYGMGAGGSETAYLLGMEYAPLRREFQGIAYEVRKHAKKVLITTGGSDRYNLAGRILELALKDPVAAQMEYCVVSGAYNEYLPQLRLLENVNEKIHVYSNVDRMWELMQSCDIAVTAGGSTMYELSAVGVPMICFSFVDNQKRIVEEFRRRELVCYGGDYLAEGQQMLAEVVENIARLGQSRELRNHYSVRQRQLVDGKGALRIAGKLRDLAAERGKRKGI